MRRRPLALALVFTAAGGCRPGAGPVSIDKAAPLILISIDTLRADRVGAYGSTLGATPSLDALARDSLLFEDAYSHCPLTLPAHASLLTGLLPMRHGVRDNAGFTLEPEVVSLATRLKAAGRATGAAVSAYVLRRATGIAQGFDFYDDAIDVDATNASLGDQQRDGARAVETLLAWLGGQAGRPLFAFLHLYEPHTPWNPPPQHRRFSHPYDGDVAYADELVGRFLTRLRETSLLERALVIVTADHGEGLGDHGEEEHGLFLYREVTRVPLLVRLPKGARGGRRVSGVVGQADVAATILDLAGLDVQGLDGVSLRGTLSGGPTPARPVYSESYFPRLHFGWSELQAATDERFRFIRAPRPELYDVREDPQEKKNLVGERPSAATAIVAWLDRTAARDSVTPERVPAEARRRLEALGYVGGGGPTAPTGPGARADPKDQVASHEAFKRALATASEGRDAESAQALRALLEKSPGMPDAWEALGLSLGRLGRDREAVSALDQALALDPSRARTHLALARVHGLAGRRALAERHAAAASALEPGEGYETLALMMLEKGRLDDAAADARKSLSADATRVMSHYVLGAVAQRRGRCEEALAAYRTAAEAALRQKGVVVRGLHAGTADCLARLGRQAEAERAFLAEIELIPASPEGRVGLAMLYRSEGRDAEARSALEGVVEKHPQPGASEYATVVRAFSVLGDSEAAYSWRQRARERFPEDRRFR